MDSRRVKFLLDENISRRILPALQQQFPGSTQVALLGMEQWDARQLWEFAEELTRLLIDPDTGLVELY